MRTPSPLLLAFAMSTSLGSLIGCGTTAPSEAEGVSESDMLIRNILLPTGDPCREVLASLAAGLAEGAAGLLDTDFVRVTLGSADESRHYAILVDGKAFDANGRTFQNDFSYEVTLDNDSTSTCRFIEAKLNQKVEITNQELTGSSRAELFPSSAPIRVRGAPTQRCYHTIRYLARGLGVSAVGPKNLKAVDVVLASETDVRNYAVHVDGNELTVDGRTFDNDAEFTIELDNDSASLCLPLALGHK